MVGTGWWLRVGDKPIPDASAFLFSNSATKNGPHFTKFAIKSDHPHVVSNKDPLCFGQNHVLGLSNIKDFSTKILVNQSAGTTV